MVYGDRIDVRLAIPIHFLLMNAQPCFRCLLFIAALTTLDASYKRSWYLYGDYRYAGRLERCFAPPIWFAIRYYQKQRKHRRIQPLYIDHRTRSNLTSTKGLPKLRTTNTTPLGQAKFELALLLERYPTFASISKKSPLRGFGKYVASFPGRPQRIGLHCRVIRDAPEEQL